MRCCSTGSLSRGVSAHRLFGSASECPSEGHVKFKEEARTNGHYCGGGASSCNLEFSERRELGCSGVTQRSELEMLGIHLCKIKQRRYVLILLFSCTSLSTEVAFPQ